MKAQVVYFSRGGHSKKLAEAIAKGAGSEAQALERASLSQPLDILFVGGAIYAGKIDAKLAQFIGELPAGQVGRVVLFSNSLSGLSIKPSVQPLLAGKNITLDQREFCCKGQFLCFNRQRPNAEDMRQAEAFAAEIVGGAE